MIGFNVERRDMHGPGRLNVNMSNYYMLHVWVLDDMKFTPDVFAGMIPCISNGTAVHNPSDPCHTSRPGATAATAARAAGAGTEAEKGVTLRASDTASGRIQYICFAGA